MPPGGTVSQRPHDQAPEARIRPRRWFTWVWAVPIASAALLLWLAWNALAGRGPAITVSFKEAQGLLPGQTKILHRSVEVGTVESLELTPDMSRVLVHARMKRVAAPYLTDTTRFYVVVARVGIGGISGLSTIVSGNYIEMYPGQHGPSRREFVGLDEPPALPPDEPGTTFVLHTTGLGSLSAGAPVTYNGVNVGQVQGYALAHDGQTVTITTFVRTPYDRLVHPETRFWSAGGLDVSVGAQGMQVRASSWQELLTGGVAFETPPEALQGARSLAGAQFDLFEDRKAALRALRGPGLVYVADFSGNVRGVELGSPVELEGMEVGEVTQARLRYDPAHHRLVTQVTFSIDPTKVQILEMPGQAAASRGQVVSDWLDTLVRHGLRAQVTDVSLLTGSKLIALDMVPDMKPARMQRAGTVVKVPTAGSGDLAALLRSARGLIGNLSAATSGPELTNALRSLDRTLAHLDQLTREVDPDVRSLVVSLRKTSDAAQGTMSTVQGLLGNGVAADSDVPQLLRELTEAVRSVRELADYLDRHPEALLRGRSKDSE
jgi:paraquat-inducible protein B